MDNQTILVTGGAGFIGNRVVSQLVARGSHVVVVDNEMVGMKLPASTALLTPVLADIRDTHTMQQVMQQYAPATVIHLAALHHIPTCEQQPHRAMDINIMGTQSVLDAMAQADVKRLVLASSAAVYAWSETALIEDQTPLQATDVYSTCKLTNEYQATIWAAKYGARVSLARIFNVIGHDDPNGHIIPDILAQLAPSASTQNAVVKLGNTTPKRDYTHADDTAQGLLALLDHLDMGQAVEAYNVSYGAEYSVSDLVMAMGTYLGLSIAITHDPARVRKIDRLHLLGSPEKMKRVTGWKAQIDFQQALDRILSHLVPAHQVRTAKG